jgi:hypothetical protein
MQEQADFLPYPFPQVTANFTCLGVKSLTAATTNITVVQRPTVTVRLGRQPAPGCGGKPAVGVFRYIVQGLQPGQDFDVAAQVRPSCTARISHSELTSLGGGRRYSQHCTGRCMQLHSYQCVDASVFTVQLQLAWS